MKKTLLIVLGPTGIGKTDLSIELAQLFNTEIISSDSRQIFKELSIGTAIPNPHQLNTVKHNFIQSHSIHNYYNVSQYESEVISTLDELFKSKDVVIMTGGSMLYIDVVCNGIDDLPSVDIDIRDKVTSRFNSEGIENLRRELKSIDPEYYAIVDLKNHKRIIHALEIYYQTGRKYSSFRTNNIKTREFKILKIGLNTDREILHNRINQRVDKMMENGLLNEVETLYSHKELNSLNTVGYKELFDYLDGQISLETAIELIKRNTRRYARRQLTWFRKDKSITWFDPLQKSNIIDFIRLELETANKQNDPLK